MRTTVIALSMILIASPLAAAAPQSADAKSSTKERKYCIEYENVTGSRIRKSACRTKAQWAREGVEVDKLLKG